MRGPAERKGVRMWKRYLRKVAALLIRSEATKLMVCERLDLEGLEGDEERLLVQTVLDAVADVLEGKPSVPAAAGGGSGDGGK